jgi:membrane protease YdiL (CAAX protease family)
MTRVFETTNWKAFRILFAAGLFGVLAILPFAFELVDSLPIDRASAPELPFAVIVLLALVQNGILLAVVIVFGMRLSHRVGLRMPLVDAWAAGEPAPDVKAIVLPGLVLGGAAGVALVTVEVLFFLQHLPASMLRAFHVPLWKRLLGGVVYGGITEELLMRLFLMSLFAWLLGKWWKASVGTPAPGAFWAAIVLVALVFGLGHLPATSLLAPLTPMIVARALVLNGIAGIAFGYLYWRYGLEAAMAGHMSTHLVLQGPGVMWLTSML